MNSSLVSDYRVGLDQQSCPVTPLGGGGYYLDGRLSATNHVPVGNQLSLPSLRGSLGQIECVPRPVWLELKRGVFTCVGWQVTLCDPIWQATSHSSEISCHECPQ